MPADTNTILVRFSRRELVLVSLALEAMSMRESPEDQQLVLGLCELLDSELADQGPRR